MQALLSYNDSPPIAAPFRFFLTAPLFGALAGVLLLLHGPMALVSRWTPDVLALTHLITTGFMLQVMLGALIQVLPVVAGANMFQPLRIAKSVHLSISAAAILLLAAFLTFKPSLFITSSLCFIVGTVIFLGAAAWAMRGVPSIGPTPLGLKIALLGLAVTVGLGVAMALGLAGWFTLPLMQLADIHLGWGLLLWGLVLLAAVAYVVVPMFQITPAYPAWLTRHFSQLALIATVGWTLSRLGEVELGASLGAAIMIGLATVFAMVTLRLQRRSKRANFDVNQYCWSVAMVCLLVAAVLWVLSGSVPAIGEWMGWPLLCGVLVLYGGFVSVITGMLYKIVPFLVWLHLQNLGNDAVLAPNMKKIINEKTMYRQMLTHAVALLLLMLAVFEPEWFSRPAGLAVFLSQVWLMANLFAAVRMFREKRTEIRQRLERA